MFQVSVRLLVGTPRNQKRCFVIEGIIGMEGHQVEQIISV